jgi:hypothetical protein
MKDQQQTLIRWAKALGYLGWLPVPVLASAAFIQPEWQPIATRVAVIYVATILCFLGGIQWGFALGSPDPDIRVRRLFVGILPSLWGFASLLLPAQLAVIGLIVGLGLLLGYEMLERADDVYPSWYLPLRIQLTILLVAGISLFVLAL